LGHFGQLARMQNSTDFVIFLRKIVETVFEKIAKNFILGHFGHLARVHNCAYFAEF